MYDNSKYPEIKVGDTIWFSPFYEMDAFGCFLVKCKITSIYYLDNTKIQIINGVPCGTVVQISSDKEPVLNGASIFYDIDEPTGRSIDRESIYLDSEFDDITDVKEFTEEDLQTYIKPEKRKNDIYNTSLDVWRDRRISFIKKTGGVPGNYPNKIKGVDWFPGW